jgi:hypothetical protein
MQVWLGDDGQVRGVGALGSITPKEFASEFSRWHPILRRIGPEEVAGVVFEAVRPGVVAEVGAGGYQAVRFTVRPKTVRCVVRPPLGLQEVAIQPMPLLV